MKITEKCTGCMACYNMCPFNAIQIINSEKGFYIPKINKEKCKNCKKCISVCPQNNIVEKNKLQNVYAVWSKDNQIRINSTSGGVFSVIAEQILKRHGIVVGALFNDNFKVIHGVIKNEKDLKKLRGSKYVQSYIGSIFRETKEYLEQRKVVLFSGVPCQIAGIKKYLEKNYENLITIDILCHGVPSPKVFEEYKKNITAKDDKISNIQFRIKKPSWNIYSMKVDFEKGKTYQKNTYEDKYSRAFFNNYITNETCSECKYIGTERVGDITLGDFWGYISEEFKYRNTEKGISLVLINTEKGKSLFNEISKDIVFIKKDIDEAILDNQSLKKYAKKSEDYKEFWNCYNKCGYKDTFEKYIHTEKISKKRRVMLFFYNHAYLVPMNLRKKLIQAIKKRKH